MAEYFWKGLLIGLIFGVPAGAIGALTIGRTLEKGFAAGFLTGMGSSAADMKKVSFVVITICMIGALTGCGNSVPMEEPPQNFSNIESDEFSEGTESEGQSDEIQSSAEENSGLSAEREEQEQIQSEPQVQNDQQVQNEPMESSGLESEEMNILMKIGDEAVTVAWEDNESARALTELLGEQPLSIQMSMYGGFEQVGSLGTSLPREDVQTTTQAGDIVLYSGSQIVVFYGSNSWAYTRLGRITDKSAEELAELLSNGDVTVTLELQ